MTESIDAALALTGGVLTIASPCVLPILPIVLGATLNQGSRSRPLLIVAGFVLAFAGLGMLLAGASRHLVTAHETVRQLGIAILLLAGLAMLWRAPYAWLLRHITGLLPDSRPHDRTGAIGALLLGMSLGAVWTPCAGLVLASILVLVATAPDVTWSATLLLLYACGAAIPMLAIAYGGRWARSRIAVVARYTDRLQQGFGVLIVATALLFHFQYDALLYARLANLVSP
ncbi:cytochrome c biogenesis protein CcdA [Duganella sp. 3397]|uniref:cytochrome c biogenesis CcdA family protein n=1 Tax=Duganella sp. 3397 TaxID=2817732 RepID=UPI00286308B5|nr:cytochrome c biogenesis CcdA family protein [Duganella sp. 3397]MDR7047950.1 cytochrome c biogenesis protein CcdA [Duganella sp. 3397]